MIINDCDNNGIEMSNIYNGVNKTNNNSNNKNNNNDKTDNNNNEVMSNKCIEDDI